MTHIDFRRWIILIGLAAVSSVAKANGPQTGLINGGTLQWTAANTLYLQPGWVFAAGTAYGIDSLAFGQNLTTTGTHPYVYWSWPNAACTGTQDSQKNSATYYVYLGWDINTNPGSRVVVSTVSPTHDAYPSQTVSWMDSRSNCQQGGSEMPFLGSFVTDGNSNIVPFSRVGDEVHLYADQNATSQQPSWNETGWWITNNSGVPTSKVFSFSPFPASAASAIVDIWSWTWDSNKQYPLFFEDPYALGVGAGPNYDIHPQMMWFLASNYNQQGQNDVIQSRLVPDLNGNITLWTAKGSSTTQNGAVALALKGYVEVVNSPGR